MEIPPKDEVMTVKEACAYLKIAEKTLYRFIREQKIPAFKLGREWRFKKSLLDQWIDEKIRESYGQ
ncbi:MAG: helix-turn-helix domain-containing protein [Deltaproteobacteria bacterium]|nr:helix-turn-helix domain-containing protein [Deltaproteobacteria bacterium]